MRVKELLGERKVDNRAAEVALRKMGEPPRTLDVRQRLRVVCGEVARAFELLCCVELRALCRIDDARRRDSTREMQWIARVQRATQVLNLERYPRKEKKARQSAP